MQQCTHVQRLLRFCPSGLVSSMVVPTTSGCSGIELKSPSSSLAKPNCIQSPVLECLGSPTLMGYPRSFLHQAVEVLCKVCNSEVWQSLVAVLGKALLSAIDGKTDLLLMKPSEAGHAKAAA